MLRRLPKRMAEMGTPAGFSYSGERLGHCLMETVNLEFGCAAGLPGPRLPGVPAPVQQSCRELVFDALPPGFVGFGVQGRVRKQGGVEEVPLEGPHHVRVGFERRPRSDPEEPVFGVDGVEAAVRADPHPGDVVPQGPDAVTGESRFQHGQVCFSGGGGQGGQEVTDFARGIFDTDDDHVLGQPTFFLAEPGSDPERETLFSQERVSPVSRTDAPDQVLLRKVHDKAFSNVKVPHRVEPLHEIFRSADFLDDAFAHPGHDPHAHGDVGAVRELNAGLGQGESGWPIM